jgi:hypothetical protein
MAKAAEKIAAPVQGPQEIEPSRVEQLLDKVLQKVTDTEARVARLEASRGSQHGARQA